MANLYVALIESVFFKSYKKGDVTVEFSSEELATSAEELGLRLPNNLGDIIYSFRYRQALPNSIINEANSGREWVMRPAGEGLYRFTQVPISSIAPSLNLFVTKIPNSTPGIVESFAMNDEQALLELGTQDGRIVTTSEEHYRLVGPAEISPEELVRFRERVKF